MSNTMINMLSDIVDVQITLNTLATSSASFSHILIAGPPPKEPIPDILLPDVATYGSIDELVLAGFITTGANADPIGRAANVAFSQSPKPEYIMVAVQKDQDDELEDIIETLNRAVMVQGWYGLAVVGQPVEKLEEIAAWTESREKMLSITYMTPKLGFTNTNFYRTNAWFGNVDGAGGDRLITPPENEYLNVAQMVKHFAFEPGEATAAFKQLSAISPSSLSSTDMRRIQDESCNYFTVYADRAITQNGKVLANEWMDTIRFRDWLINEIQIEILNLFIKSPKIPYTNAGIRLVENRMITALRRGQQVGGIAPDQYTNDGTKIPGFTTSVPFAYEMTNSDRQARILRNMRFTALLAGAINKVQIRGDLTLDYDAMLNSTMTA